VLWQAATWSWPGSCSAACSPRSPALVALGALLVWLAGIAATRSRGIWRLGLAGLARRPAAAILQIVGFGLGILALLLLAVVRLDLLRSWQETLPEGAPNRFPDQHPAAGEVALAHGSPSATSTAPASSR
jgi:putative ABC transport system permease protein